VEQPLEEDWEFLLTLFPRDWEVRAVLSGALERLRGFGSAGQLLRVLLMHVGLGYSLRETAVRARQSGLAEVSDVAILNRLRKAGPWWRQMCLSLLEESGFALPLDTRGWKLRALDSTLVKEPGRAGRLWRIHYSLRLPELECDHFELTPVKGRGNGETLERFAAAPHDLVLADRGFSKPGPVVALSRKGAAVIVRLNTRSLPLYTAEGRRFDLPRHIRPLGPVPHAAEWKVWVRSGSESVAGRLCVIRKSEQASRQAQKKIRRKTQQGGPEPRPETLLYAGYVMVFTNLPAEEFDAADVLECYRLRWQIELVFKRLKSLAQLGNLPKYDEHSARAWLYGKLLLALLGQKLMRLGRDISPWGYEIPPVGRTQRLAAV
jgi:Transposase DDE domain